MITDSHCHLASSRFSDEERLDIIARAEQAGVSAMVTLATSLSDLRANLELADHPAVRAALGIHPCDVHAAPDDAVEQVAKYLNDPRVCAVGETGLDYYHPAPEGWEEEDFRERQRQFLERHFKIAQAAGLNIVIHTRDKEGSQSFADAVEIYRAYAGTVKAVFHCFVSEWKLAEEVLSLGGFISLGGVCTFKNAGEAKEAAVRCPAGKFMLETDAPYLAPVPLRGKRNEPAYVDHTALCIAELRGESFDDLAAHTQSAVKTFFRWAK